MTQGTKKTPKEIRKLWQRFDGGEALPDDEDLEVLATSAEKGLEFCLERGERLISVGIAADLRCLRNWQHNRQFQTKYPEYKG